MADFLQEQLLTVVDSNFNPDVAGNSDAYKAALRHQMDVEVQRRNADHQKIDLARRDQIEQNNRVSAGIPGAPMQKYVPQFYEEMVTNNSYGWPQIIRSLDFLVPPRPQPFEAWDQSQGSIVARPLSGPPVDFASLASAAKKALAIKKPAKKR